MNVKHNAEASRFEAEVEGELAVVEYMRVGDRLDFMHVEVPRELRGRGLGAQLVQGAVEATAELGLKIRPVCPFARDWMADHPEHHDKVA